MQNKEGKERAMKSSNMAVSYRETHKQRHADSNWKLGVGSEPLGMTNDMTCKVKEREREVRDFNFWQWPWSWKARGGQLRLSASDSEAIEACAYPVLHLPVFNMLATKALVLCRGEFLIDIYGWKIKVHRPTVVLEKKKVVEFEAKHLHTIVSQECCDFKWFLVPIYETSTYNDIVPGQWGRWWRM